MTSYILHTNKIPDASITATEATSGELENAYDWLTYDYWQADASGNKTYVMDFGSSVSIDAWAVGFHDLVDNSGTVTVQYSSDGFVSDVNAFDTTYTPTGGELYVRYKSSISARYWRFVVNSTGSASKIGLLYLGEALALPYAPRTGSVIPVHGRNNRRSNTLSEGGRFLGRVNYLEGFKFSIDQKKVALSWIDSNLETLLDALEANPVIYIWDQENKPTETVYCWLSGKVSGPTLSDYAGDPLYNLAFPMTGVRE